jgi:hypothetical protein
VDECVVVVVVVLVVAVVVVVVVQVLVLVVVGRWWCAACGRSSAVAGQSGKVHALRFILSIQLSASRSQQQAFHKWRPWKKGGGYIRIYLSGGPVETWEVKVFKSPRLAVNNMLGGTNGKNSNALFAHSWDSPNANAKSFNETCFPERPRRRPWRNLNLSLILILILILNLNLLQAPKTRR